MSSQHYNQFRIESMSQLQSLSPSSIKLFANDPIQENYTVVLRPDEDTLSTLSLIIAQLKTVEPNQYYYPLDTMHLTLIGNIPLQVDSDILVDAVQEVIATTTLVFELKGLASNSYCSSFSAFPKDFSIHDCRASIRRKTHACGDDFSSILTSYEHVGWINYLRYLVTPKQSFFEQLYSYKDVIFGEMKPCAVQIYKNTSKILDPSKTFLVKSFIL